MNNRIAVRKCTEYNLEEIVGLIREIYKVTEGPDVKGRKVLLKPNILSDNDPAKCISTHPVVFEAMAMFLKEEGAIVVAGDSPAIHLNRFRPVKSGIWDVCERMGIEWINFTENPVEKALVKGKIKVASIVDNVDLIFSLPKFKNHELVYFTGAIKNTLGLVPAFSKTKQHALHSDRNGFSELLVDLNEAVTPHYFLMDGIIGMEGPGPARGIPVNVGVLLGSTNPLALDIMASKIAGYNTLVIPTSKIALHRKKWLQSVDDIIYDGPDIKSLVKTDFRRIPLSGSSNISLKFIMNRIGFVRKFDRRPVFLRQNCTGCHKCVKICPVGAIKPSTSSPDHIILTDKKCIRCFCCSEVCGDYAIEIRRKVFGA
ncbi:MAG TPA: DUF362 domain-containing protein [Bacteroidales bacterium]|nr:DUF362 domain-containing protein [Bacteroidales bacterium]